MSDSLAHKWLVRLTVALTVLLCSIFTAFAIDKLVEELNEPKSGTIVFLDHQPAHITVNSRCVVYLQAVCYEWKPVTTRHPDKWTVIYEDAAGARGDAEVSGEEFATYEIGDTYTQAG